MSSFDPKAYGSILRVKRAYAFDLGCFLMRFYSNMMNIGTVTMVTLAGYSFFIAGLVSSVIALSTFVISPRISKLIDVHSQHKIVPFAALITMLGLAILLVNVQMHNPEWTLFVGAVLMGFIPNPQALARARWTFLIRSGRLGGAAPDLRTMFSYEGVLDDISFMFSPAISIALASAITPIAGLLAGGIGFITGSAMLILSRSTEPTPGWSKSDQNAKQDVTQKGTGQEENSEKDRGDARSLLRTSSVVRVLFTMMFFTGAFFGVFDSATVALAEELGDPNIASIALMVASFVSMTVSFLFGMFHLRISQTNMLIIAAAFMGLSYGTMFLIDSALTLFIVSTVSAFFYAPLLITANATCERAVPGNQITEAITWINAGTTCGMAFGPSIGGIIIDNMGATASFDFGAILAICVPITAILGRKILKRNVRAYT